jgi:hypothetical protein
MSDGRGSLTVVAAEAARATTRGAQDRARQVVEQSVPVEALQQGFTRFLGGLREMVGTDPGSVGDFVLDEITLSVEIGADGEFKLLGTGVGVSASSAVSFVLRRQQREST